MKNYFLIFALISFGIASSCKKQNNYISETESSEIFSSMQIDSIVNPISETAYIITSGNKTVFKYNHTWSNNTPGYVDAFTDYTFAFAIDLLPSKASFVLTDDQIAQAQAFYRYFTGDGSTRWALVKNGKITGTKINNTTWSIAVHISSGPYPDLVKNFTVK